MQRRMGLPETGPRLLFLRSDAATTPQVDSSGCAYVMGGWGGLPTRGSLILDDLWRVQLHGHSEIRFVPVKMSGKGPGFKIKHRCAQAGNALFVFGGVSFSTDGRQGLDDNLYIMDRGDEQLHGKP